MRSQWIWVGFIVLLFAQCKKVETEIPDKGVSFQLNEYRKQTIQHITYTIELDIPAVKSEVINGKNKLSFTLSSIDKPLVIDFNVESSLVKSVKSNDKDIPYQFLNEHIVINPEYLKKGLNEIDVEFTAGNLSLNRNDNYLYTLFVPDRASTCFPLFDQPNLKACYEVTLRTPADWEAVSNGELVEQKNEDDKTVSVFGKTKPISSYLFAFAAGKFLKKQKEVNGRSMTMYYRETDSIKVKRNANEIFNLHDKSIAWLEEYTSIKYPFDKFDFVLIPAFQYGGMEHPGSIFYSESGLFLDENASINRQLGRASLIAHETAHMWFGDLVTMDWFNDVWMKEVFANFMAAKIVQPSFPEIDHKLRFLLAHYPSAYEVDRSKGANPIIQPLDNLKNAGTLYGAIIYQKAPVVMRHLEKRIGEELMRESLRDYLKAFSYNNAKWDDLIHIIDEKTPDDIESWSNVWVKTTGMPEYEWKENGTFVQQRDSLSGRIWQQPLQMEFNKKDTLISLTSTSGVQLKKVADPYFPNTDGFSYGYFKMSEASKKYFLTHSQEYTDPAFRASMWMNCWEGMLRSDGPDPEFLLKSLQEALKKEQNPLLVDFLLGKLQNVWWTFLSDDVRQSYQKEIEDELWSLMTMTKDKGMKSSYFRSYRDLAMSEKGLKQLEDVWSGKLKVPDLTLSEDDNIGLAYELALKKPEQQEQILKKQLDNIKNPDRQSRMKFVMPALSDKEEVRDSFFESLKKEENREHEAWVLEALNYLHHPLRAKTSIKYLRPSLDLLQEIQLTGDIFFPQRWLHTTFEGYSSTEAAQVSKQFLKEHPDYPAYLKNKILQSTDVLERAAEMKKLSVK